MTAEPASEDRYRVLGPGRQVWLPTLELMIPPNQGGLCILELETDPDGGRTSTRLAQRAGADSVVVSVSEDPAVTARARAAYGRQDGFEFHTGPLTRGWPDGGPYDVVIALRKMSRLPFAWLRQCAPDAVILCPVELVRSPRRAGLMAMFLAQGLITWPQLMFVTEPGTGRWVHYRGGPILHGHDDIGYTVRLNPDPVARDPAATAKVIEPADVTLARWVTPIDPRRPAHLVPIEFSTRGVAWSGLCGHRFNATGYAAADHYPRCTSCKLIYDAECRAAAMAGRAETAGP